MALQLVAVFLASFVWVFLQGFQSRSVNSGEHLWAFCGSFALGTAQVFVLSSVIKAGSAVFTFTYCLGGACAIVCAMHVFARLKARKDSRCS